MEPNTFPLELLTNDNYADWNVKMKNNLLAQGLWDIVETDLEPPQPDDDVVEYEAWRKMNDAALHAIQSSCGVDILSRINRISSAKIAWEMLAKMFKKLRQVLYNTVEQGHSCSSNISGSTGQDMPTGTGDNQRVESGNSLDNQCHSNSNILDNGQNKLMQAEAVDPIINEGNSSSSYKSGTKRDDYAALLKAVSMGDWNRTREFLELHPHALTARMTTFLGGTVLHAAIDAEQENIVEKLVNMISEQDLATMKDGSGDTALHQAAISGNYRVAGYLIAKNKRLVSIIGYDNKLPVTLAMALGHKELARYLYSQTPFQDLEVKEEEGCQGASLFNYSLETRDLDMALDLMERCPSLAFAMDGKNVSPFEKLAVATDAFESIGKGMVFWKQWIYNHCIHINSSTAGTATDQVRLNINQNGQEKTIGSVRALWRKLASSLLNLFGFKHLYEMKLARLQFQQLLSRMCEAIPTNTSPENRYETISPVIFRAISRGNFEFVYHMVKANSDLLLIADVSDGRGILDCAVLHRQHKIFSLIYSLKNKNSILNGADNSRNTILHMAGMLTEHTPIDHIRGAALQMQREVQWFQEVECIGPLSNREYLNKDGLTPKQLFTMTHQKLKKEGEQWMKETATSCSFVGALIVTIMFAAAFVIPGGNNQDTSLPILMHDKLLKIFIVNDSLSLFSSSTSVLMFLGILTARNAEEDFLKSLPKRMIIGLFTLFFSITTMMIAFSTALLLIFRGQLEFVIPIISLASVPIVLFALMQFRLLVDMYVSTYCTSGIFNRKMKPWL